VLDRGRTRIVESARLWHTGRMEIALYAVCIGAIATLVGGLIMVRALRNAPEGYESADGFHAVQATPARSSAQEEGGFGVLV
jgi:predicted small integral membrane protein